MEHVAGPDHDSGRDLRRSTPAGEQAVHRGHRGGQVDGIDHQVIRPDRECRVGPLIQDQQSF